MSELDEDWVESECTEHGLDRHVYAHEAGHAVAALEFGIPFEAVAVYGDAGPAFDGGLTRAAAAIEMCTDIPSEWVRPNPLASLRFVLAGVAAEHALLGHSIHGGYDEDLRVWRRGMDLLGELTMDDLSDVLGAPFHFVWQGVENWALERAPAIERLARHLEGTGAPARTLQAEALEILQVGA